MEKLTDKCCPKCIDSEFQRCPKFTECLARRPLSECHEDEECVTKRNAVIHKIRYGNGILLKLGGCSYLPTANLGAIISAIFTELRRRELSHVSLSVTGGLGDIADAPFLLVCDPKAPTIVYARVTEAMIPRIISQHIEQHRVVREWVLGQFSDDDKKLLDSVPIIQYLDFFRSQNLRVMRRCGQIDPDSLDEFFFMDGFLSLSKALHRMSPDEVMNMIGVSGLRGRGGSGDYIIKKWMRFTSQTDNADNAGSKKAQSPPVKYLICNAHEGYSLAIKDQHILEGDPFALLEGMLVTAYAVQATEGMIYINPSYQLGIKRLQRAIELARANNYLGKGILGTDFSFDIEIRRAPSSYLSGEETAIIAFLEGDIGTRPVPPYVEETGLWGHPTLIHNVETFLNVALLAQHDFSWFTSVGITDNPGTKCFTLAGAIKRPGIIEIPLGAPMQEIVFDIGGGSNSEYAIKAVQIGGPLGGYLPVERFNLHLDHDALESMGLRVGAGTIEALDASACIVNQVRKHFVFTLQELCGQCVAGREGIYQIASFLQALCEGKELPGKCSDIAELLRRLNELTAYVKSSSLCVFCRQAITSLTTSLSSFQKEYEDHLQKRCPAGECF